MKLFVGIDLHGSNNVIVIRDETGKNHLKKRLKNDLELVLNQLAPFKEQVEAITVESTPNWYWLVDGLMNHGYPVKLANPVKIQQYNGIKHTNDMSDAEFLAELLCLDILPSGYICPRETRHGTGRFLGHRLCQGLEREEAQQRICVLNCCTSSFGCQF